MNKVVFNELTSRRLNLSSGGVMCFISVSLLVFLSRCAVFLILWSLPGMGQERAQ